MPASSSAVARACVCCEGGKRLMLPDSGLQICVVVGCEWQVLEKCRSLPRGAPVLLEISAVWSCCCIHVAGVGQLLKRFFRYGKGRVLSACVCALCGVCSPLAHKIALVNQSKFYHPTWKPCLRMFSETPAFNCLERGLKIVLGNWK